MRNPLLAGLLLLLVPACLTNEITGIGGGGDDKSDDGSDTGSDEPTPSTPRVTATFDKTSLATENGRTETLTVNLTATGGFAGDVTLSKQFVDASSTAIPGITLDGPASVTLAENGTATAAYTITLPSNTTGSEIEAQLKVSLASTAGAQDLASAVTIKNIYTVDYAANTGTTATNHPMAGATINIKRGTILRFINDDSIVHIIHGDGTFPHEDQTAGGAAGRTYDLPTIAYAPGSSGNLGCHSHGSASYATYMLQ